MIRAAVYIPWACIGVVWLVGAFHSKPTTRRETGASRAIHWVGTFLAFFLLFSPSPGFLPDKFLIRWTGAVMTWTGIGFAIAARVVLGRNWSASVTMKEGHKLMRSGPYRLVRHPIYSGALLAILGTSIAFNRWWGLGAFILALAAWRRKLLTEEQFMLELFGDDYRAYQREVKSLIPGVL